MDDRPFESINVIPFVDIMLVLLAIVLTTASFISTGRIPVSLPQVAKADVEKRKDQIIELPANGEIYFEGKSVSKETLEAKLKELPPETSVLIRADRSIRFHSFIDIADLLKRLKISKVGVQTESASK